MFEVKTVIGSTSGKTDYDEQNVLRVEEAEVIGKALELSGTKDIMRPDGSRYARVHADGGIDFS